jgi:hypothetical protein
MKAKHALAILTAGYALNFFGSFWKLMHRSGADFILLFATILTIVGLLLLFYKLVKYPALRDFFDR